MVHRYDDSEKAGRHNHPTFLSKNYLHYRGFGYKYPMKTIFNPKIYNLWSARALFLDFFVFCSRQIQHPGTTFLFKHQDPVYFLLGVLETWQCKVADASITPLYTQVNWTVHRLQHGKSKTTRQNTFNKIMRQDSLSAYLQKYMHAFQNMEKLDRIYQNLTNENNEAFKNVSREMFVDADK